MSENLPAVFDYYYYYDFFNIKVSSLPSFILSIISNGRGVVGRSSYPVHVLCSIKFILN